ncbi:NUDIX hydrolase domain protein [Pseudocohnilembus persalinus]|uniref:Oxidized purine nucleoside triphosphate hydrolase n=1 Tax=Pseudocohnilembus persalinus TaxID=266149 RepID=A0A0V0QWD6_PSEPJ|nr:NUDIX hydrolase domain protein [Pseudocohnilembus persalinus]|eukprot:KRX06639.1 NUDIX hydrolase domain protein [Pseudocohnilembus persalinus]
MQQTKPNKAYTLVFIFKNNCQQVLLGQKKRGFGEGKWNGFGGKVEKDESIKDAAIREMWEESGIKIQNQDLKFQGFMTFDMDTDMTKLFRIHIFTATKYEGNEIETDEMKPQWFDINKIPYEQMWLDDKIWYPYMFDKKFFNCFCHFKDQNEILDCKIEELKNLEHLLQIQKQNCEFKLE